MTSQPSPDPAASRQDSDHSNVEVRAANAGDLPELVALIDDFVTANRLLPRTLDELKDLIPSGFVAIWQDRLVGFAALEVYSTKLGEVRSLAVRPEAQGLGLGKQLVEMCVNLAKSRNVLEVMAVTSNEAFFQACGFDFTLPGEKKALFLQTREDVEIPRDSNNVNS
ncbi:MAG: GNAT family N-acetyltransferase [Fuerstiella sp.]